MPVDTNSSERQQQLEQINTALFRISQSSIRGRRLALDDLKWQSRVELSTASFTVLNGLAGRSMRLTELAAGLHVTGPSVSRQVQILHDKGLVERVQDDKDARAMIVQLTPKGAEVIAETARSRMALLHRVLADWDDQDVERLAPVLGRLADELAKWDHR